MSQEEPEEKEIFPGVYFTDLRKNKGAPAASNPVYATQGEALQLEIRELENSIWHMKRSNQEINQVLQAEGHDQELVDAIEGQLTTLSPLAVADLLTYAYFVCVCREQSSDFEAWDQSERAQIFVATTPASSRQSTTRE